MILSNKRKITNVKEHQHLVTYSNTDSIVSNQFRTIRTNINFLAGEKQDKVFLITSPGDREGKSITTANLAVSIAQQKEKVLLIDANLRNPTMHQIFKTVNDVGLTDFLQGKVTEHEAICRTGIGKLDILSSGITSYNPAELLGNEIMEKLLNQNAAHYGIVLIDAPNILDSVETRILANQADGVVLVLQRGKTDLDEVVEAKKILDLAHARLVGTIINDK